MTEIAEIKHQLEKAEKELKLFEEDGRAKMLGVLEDMLVGKEYNDDKEMKKWENQRKRLMEKKKNLEDDKNEWKKLLQNELIDSKKKGNKHILIFHSCYFA